jgi:hypothetical protein
LVVLFFFDVTVVIWWTSKASRIAFVGDTQFYRDSARSFG